MDHLLSNGTRVTLPEHQTFYRLLTSSNGSLISDDEQEVLRGAGVLIVGCGAVGSQTAEALVRTGAEWLTLVDPHPLSHSHLGRVTLDLRALERNRAEALSDRLNDFNPYATLQAMPEGITSRNVEHLVAGSDIVIDALGIRTAENLHARLRLHAAAKEHQVPVISGFDVASAGWVIIYDYRDPSQATLDGSVSIEELENLGEIDQIQVLTRMISLSKAPIEVVRETERLLTGQTTQLARLGYAAQLVAALISQVILDVLLEHPVRRVISIDLAAAARPSGSGLKLAARRRVELYSLRRRLASRRKRGRVGVFSPLDDEVFQELKPYMEERTYETGSVIVRQGDPSFEFFVILEGSVQVEREDPQTLNAEDTHELRALGITPEERFTIIAELGPGDYFGEMGLLRDVERTASVVVAERCRVLSLSRGAFELYLDESGPAKQRLREMAMSRERNNETQFGL
jgi:CRP-like cAMP-binding protein/molybdopterin/thiamine biosynthesis adenylyltransferase